MQSGMRKTKNWLLEFDTLNTGIYPIPFNIPRDIDVKMECGESISIENFEEL